MANTGYKQGSVAHLLYSAGSPIDGVAVADGAVLTSDAVSLDLLATRVYTVTVVEDNTGACDGNFYISILGSDLDPDSEGYQAGPTTGATPVYTDAVMSGGIIDPVQSTTRISPPISVSGSQCPRHKVHVLNDGGQELAVTINYVDIDVPPAS